ncbi:Uncharacterized protein TCM_015030 [Theobroma cacao]|uniref:Glycosyl transferase 64 domain-containing protein n=1 Tax=Theobroma cacao TaxID=3641 RepID=A0A061G1C7_THECC|nr:Uncharacterized protein TCM_015030 [Theobroma cacao]
MSSQLLGPTKIELFILFCSLCVVVSLAFKLNSFMGWNPHLPSSVSSPFRGGYTVLINTWKRKSLLKNSVAHCSSCGGSDAIRVLWSETHPPSEAEFQVRDKRGR